MSGEAPAARPLVVLYLYVHSEDERFLYPSSRASADAGELAERYLECALVQAASLRLRDADCDVALVTNVGDRSQLGARSGRLIERMEALGVEMLHAPYTHRPKTPTIRFAASRYVFDAIEAATEGQPGDRPVWFVDVDCVWVDPARAFAKHPASPGGVGCVHIIYPSEMDIFGYTRVTVGQLAHELGAASNGVADWVGGELLVGAVDTMRALSETCVALDADVTATKEPFKTEEQLLSLAGALGRLEFYDMSADAWRIWTGPRHDAPPHPDPLSLMLWHLPAEKGLSFRRAAQELERGDFERLRTDLARPELAARRFNVAGNGIGRRLRDNTWIALQRLRETVTARRATD